MQRIRASRQSIKERSRQSDITKILFARCQEDDYDTDTLYALFSALSQEQVTELYRAIRDNKWHLMPEENREAFLRQYLPEDFAEYFDLLTDFRCSGYRTGTQATREMYVDYILSKELSGGGWCLSGGEAEIDITAMALQALAKYQDRHDVADSINRALDVVSEQQNENGGYTAYGVDSSETVSQVIIALTELGVSIEDDRFVKGGNMLKDRLLEFMSDDNGFKHLLGDETNPIATEQAFYALVALYRAEQGESSLYRMTISE